MALKSVKSIIQDALTIFRQKLLSDTPVQNDSKHALSLAGAYNLMTMKKTVYRKSSSVTVSAAQYYNICSQTIPANSGQWLILAGVASSVNNQSQIILSSLKQTGLSVFTGRLDARTTMYQGGGCVCYAYAEAGSSDATVTLQCYGYLTTSHTEAGNMICINL